MRKQFYYVQGIIVLGLLSSTTSCVKDNESDSVKQVREAYANQLKAQVELAKTQAEAAKIKQEAEIALLNAQAEQLKAQAKLDEANAALLIAQSDIEKKKAETDQKIAEEELKRLQAQTKVEVEQAKYKLEELKIEAEIQMLNLKAELDKAKNQKDEILTQAINEYKILINEANTLKNSIGNEELELTYLQGIIKDVEAAKEADTALSIEQYNTFISTIEAKIETNKQAITNWKAILQSAGGESLEKEISDATSKYQALLLKHGTEYTEYIKASNTFKNGAKKDLIDFQNLVGKSYIWNASFPYDRTYYTLEEINVSITSSNKEIERYKNSIADWETQQSSLRNELSSLQTKRDETKATMDEAYEAYQEADRVYWQNSTWENWQKRDEAYDKYSAARSAYYTADSDYDNALSQIRNLDDSINRYKGYINNEEESLIRYNKQKEAYKGDAKIVDKLIAAYLKEKDVFDTAQKKYYDFQAQITALGDYLNELNKIYVSYELMYPNWSSGSTSISTTSYDYIQSLITKLNKEIAESEARVIKYKKDLTNTKELNKKAIAEMDLQIETLTNSIATNKTQLGIVQKQADAAKVIIDQRLK